MATRKTTRAKVYYSDRRGRIFGEKSFSSCKVARAWVAREEQLPGVKARVVCKKRRK